MRSIGECPILSGYSVYSQNNEDGILADIFSRLGIHRPIIFEFGVVPQENNSNLLLLKGSKGCWIDKGLCEFRKGLPFNNTLKVFDEFITLYNILL